MADVPSWKVLAELASSDHRIFKLHTRRVQNPKNGDALSCVVLETSDWVNVIPVTTAGEVVLVRQFRFGTWAPTLEIPGGVVDAGESPETAGTRELLEETGYRAGKVVALGFSHPNPAIMGNRLYSYLALDCERVHGGAQEATEDIRVELVPRAGVAELVRTGEITHALVMAALYLGGLRE